MYQSLIPVDSAQKVISSGLAAPVRHPAWPSWAALKFGRKGWLCLLLRKTSTIPPLIPPEVLETGVCWVRAFQNGSNQPGRHVLKKPSQH